MDYMKFWSPAFDTMEDFVFLLDTDFNIVRVNKSFAAFTKKDESYFAGRKCYEIVHAANTPAKECPNKRMLETKKYAVNTFYDANLKKWLHVMTTPIFDDQRSLIGSIHIAADITRQKMADTKLEESERRARAIFDQTYQFIGLMTPDGTLIEANRTALNFSGIEEPDVMGKPFWETPWWTHSKDLQERLREAVKKAAQGEFIRFEATHLAKDRSLHYVDFSLKPVKDDKGKVIYLIPEGRDITERKKIEEELTKRIDSLERFQKVMVGRELKMKELKARITELEKKINLNSI